MTEYLSELINRISRIQTTLPIKFAEFFGEFRSEEIIDLNVSQLRKGLTNDGEPITPEYASEEYAQFKQSIGSQAPPGTPDLILEGDFVGAFYTERRGENILIDSSDEKTPQLDAKYQGVFGLTSESRSDLIEDNVDELINIIENEIFN